MKESVGGVTLLIEELTKALHDWPALGGTSVQPPEPPEGGEAPPDPPGGGGGVPEPPEGGGVAPAGGGGEASMEFVCTLPLAVGSPDGGDAPGGVAPAGGGGPVAGLASQTLAYLAFRLV